MVVFPPPFFAHVQERYPGTFLGNGQYRYKWIFKKLYAWWFSISLNFFFGPIARFCSFWVRKRVFLILYQPFERERESHCYSYVLFMNVMDVIFGFILFLFLNSVGVAFGSLVSVLVSFCVIRDYYTILYNIHNCTDTHISTLMKVHLGKTLLILTF